MDYLKIYVKKGRAVWVNELLDMAQIICLFSMVLCVLVRKHNETFMIIDSSKGSKVEGRLVAYIEVRQTNKCRIKRRTQSDVPAVLASL